MKTSLVAGVALGLVLAASPSFAAKKHFKSVIENGNTTTGMGEAQWTFDDVTNRLCGKATYTGLTGGAVTAVALKNANDQSLVRSLTPSASPIVVDVTLTTNEIILLNEVPPDLYIAIGNAGFPVSTAAADNGEINGELVPDPNGTDQCPEEPDAGTDAGEDSGTDSGTSSSGSSATRRHDRPGSPLADSRI